MHRFRAFVLALPLIAITSVAQVTGEIYRFPKDMPARYQVDARADYERMVAEPYGKQKQRDIERFAELTAYSKKHLMASGGVYFDPPMAEAYLARIASKLHGEASVRVYLSRDAAFNAFTIHDGSLFFNVGLLAEMPNEAALAGIMGHEMAHYLHDDNRSGFYSKLDLYTRRNRNSNYELRIDKAHEDRTMEHLADSVGALLARKAGYDLRWMAASFMLLLDPHAGERDSTTTEDDLERAKATALQALLADHPETTDRIAFINGWIASDSAMRGGGTELVDGGEFLRVRRMARIEALQVLMESHEYHACVERAFRYHLIEPEEEAYLYFLAEGLRRYLYIVPDVALDGFLIQGYEKHFPMRTGILQDLSFLIRDSIVLAGVDTTVYYADGKPVFNNYADALKYFLEEGDSAGVTEVLLSKALQYRKDPKIRDDALERYLAQGGAATSFVEALKNNQLERRLRKCKGGLVLLDEVEFIEDHTYGFRVRHVLAEERGPIFSNTMRGVIARYFPERTVVEIADLRREDIGSYMSYERVAGNLAIVEWMWSYEKERAEKREQLRGQGRLKRAKKVSVTERTADLEGLEEGDTTQTAADDAELEKEKWKRRKRTKQDMKFYYIDPLYWEFLVDKGFGTVEYIKAKAFDDKTRIAGNAFGTLFFLYPGYWATRISNGSNRYAFKLDHVKFSTETQQVNVRETLVNYKMTRPHLKSVLFDSMIGIGQ